MSSLVRELSQIKPRIRYYLAVQTTDQYSPDNYRFSAIMTETAFANHTVTTFGDSATIYRDMGKQIITLNAQKIHTSTYRLVQMMRGIASEGISSDWESDSFYIRIWSAEPYANPITVVRTG